MTESDTHTHLLAIFADVSQSAQRLLWFAETADVDGYPELASSFRAIAEDKAGHARGLLEFIDGLDRETPENLAAALSLVDLSGDLERIRSAADDEGRPDVAEWVGTMSTAADRHVARLNTDRETLR